MREPCAAFIVFVVLTCSPGQPLTPLRARGSVGPCSGMYHWWPATSRTSRGEEHYAKSSTKAHCFLTVQPFPYGVVMAGFFTHSLALPPPPPAGLHWEDMNGNGWSHLLTCNSGQLAWQVSSEFAHPEKVSCNANMALGYVCENGMERSALLLSPEKKKKVVKKALSP